MHLPPDGGCDRLAEPLPVRFEVAQSEGRVVAGGPGSDLSPQVPVIQVSLSPCNSANRARSACGVQVACRLAGIEAPLTRARLGGNRETREERQDNRQVKLTG